jgi:hypothetical protein
MSLGIVQQGGTKNDRQNLKNKQPTTHEIVFVFSLNFPRVVVFCNFFIFSTIFLYFSLNLNTRDRSIKRFSLNRVKMWPTEN